MAKTSVGRRVDRASNDSSKPGRQVVACVEVHAVSAKGSKSVNSTVLWGLAVRRMERCLRPGDWMCTMGAGRLAVCFGNGAHQISPSALGARLARALGDHLSVGTSDLDLQVTVGIGSGENDVDAATLTAAALAGLLGERRRLVERESAGLGTRPRVVVAHVRDASGNPARLNLVRRTVDTLGPEMAGIDNLAEARDRRNGAARSDLSMLVVDPGSALGGRQSPAVEGVHAVVSRHNLDPKVTVTADPAEAVAQFLKQHPDVVVLPLRTPPPSLSAREPGTPWELWAHMARSLIQAGATVWAVGVGASVAAIAACVREGAVGVLDLWEFGEQIEKAEANLAIRRLAAIEPGRVDVRCVPRPSLPAPYDALVELTTSEHRVLYHMMRGASASDIAEQLIVSLATVRSHIRSILRKLGVSSQLAAVALANGAHPDMTNAV